MTTIYFDPPPEPHQRLARAAARRWARQHPFKAVLVRVLARLRPIKGEPLFHQLEWCPATPQEALEGALDRWFRHWHGSLAATPEGRLQLALRRHAKNLKPDPEDW
jgi:non-ribosomal peptide synthetase component F